MLFPSHDPFVISTPSSWALIRSAIPCQLEFTSAQVFSILWLPNHKYTRFPCHVLVRIQRTIQEILISSWYKSIYTSVGPDKGDQMAFYEEIFENIRLKEESCKILYFGVASYFATWKHTLKTREFLCIFITAPRRRISKSQAWIIYPRSRKNANSGAAQE